MAACLDTIDGTLITTKALADLLNVKEATILKYARDDGLERADAGKFELRAAIEWWTARQNSANEEFKRHQARLYELRAGKAELELRRERAQVIDYEDHANAMQTLGAQMVQALQRIPPWADELAGLAAREQRQVLDSLVIQLRGELAAEVQRIGRLASDRGTTATAARPGRGSVGGGPSRPRSRKQRSGTVADAAVVA